MTRLLITGASGNLGAYLLHAAQKQNRAATAWSGTRAGALAGYPLVPVDLTDHAQTTIAFAAAAPAVILHTAAVSTVADCYRDLRRAHAVNVAGTALLARLADAAGARLLVISTDMVFDGTQGNYREDDPPAPLSAYARTKLAAEQAVLAYPGHGVVRISLLFGPSLTGRPTFCDQQREALMAGRPVTLFTDEWRTPLALPAAAEGLLRLADANFAGVIHFGGPERLSRLEMGQRLARQLGVDPGSITAVRRDDAAAPEPRPRDVSLDSTRWRQLFPTLPAVG